MRKQTRLLFLILLLMATGLSFAENDDDTQADIDDDSLVEQESVPEVLPEKKVRPVIRKDKRRSIKMTVGGRSEGGLAKEVTLPVSN